MPAAARTVAQTLAALIGCERATLAPSTLHLFWDWFGMLAGDAAAIYLDAGVYPIARWGVERAAARGVPVRNFPHHDAEALRRQLQLGAPHRLRPLIVADGFCPGCGRSAPLPAYLKCARDFGGQLILDDTQALGILGQSPSPEKPYGQGGGGSLRWHNLSGPNILVISSLAKGFGVPMAVLAGSHAMIRQFEARSETRMHCSPPAMAMLRVAEHALAENDDSGERLRGRLTQLVRYFRDRLANAGFSATGGLFPVQALAPAPNLAAAALYERLWQRGVRTVLHRRRCGHGARVSFLLSSRHNREDLDRAVDALVAAAGEKSRGNQTRNKYAAYI